MRHKLRIALAAILVAVAAVSAVDSATAGFAYEDVRFHIGFDSRPSQGCLIAGRDHLDGPFESRCVFNRIET
jgi:hypothetical protein